MKLRFILLSPLVLLLACGGNSSPDTLRRLCPEGTGLYVELRDVAALDAEVSRIARTVEPGVRETAYVQEAIAGMLFSPDLAGVDIERPMAQLMVMVGDAPSQVMLVPVTSESKFRKGLEAHPFWEYRKDSVFLKFTADHAVIADRQETLDLVKLRTSPLPITERAGDGDLSMVVDLELLRDLLLPQIEQGFSEMEQAFDNPNSPSGVKEFMGLYLDGIRALFEQASELSMDLSLRDGVVGMEMALRARDGTDLAKLLSGSSASRPRYLPLLSTNRGMAMEVHFSPESMARFFGPVYDTLYAGLDEATRANLLKALTLSDAQAIAVDLANGLSGTSISHLTDPAAYLQQKSDMWRNMNTFLDDYFKTMLPPDAMGENGEPPIRIKVTSGDAWDHAGVTVQPTAIGIEISGDLAGQVPPELEKALKFFLGGNDLDIEDAVHGDLALMAMGPGAKGEITALIDRVLAGGDTSLPSHLNAAFKGYPERTNVLFTMDLAEIARLVANLDLDLKLTDEKMALLANPPTGLTVSGYLATGEGTVRLAGSMAILDLMRYLKPMME